MRLAPDTLWSMSLVEWNAALAGFMQRRGGNFAPPLERKSLNALMQLYPDRK